MFLQKKKKKTTMMGHVALGAADYCRFLYLKAMKLITFME